MSTGIQAVAPIRVLIADDDEAFARALARAINQGGSMKVVGAAYDAAQAIKLGASMKPDIAVLDVRMPEGGGAHAAREIRLRSPGTRMMALSACCDPHSVLEMFAAGVCGYMVKGSTSAVIRDAIATASRGGSPLSDGLGGIVAAELARRMAGQQVELDRLAALRDRVGRAVSGDGLSMAFQPIVDLGTGTLLGVEALARFEGPPRQSPATWLLEAEEVGMREELELAAVGLAVDVLPRLPDDAFVAINVGPSAVTSPHLAEQLPDEHAHRIVVELTDHGRGSDYEVLAEALAKLRARGIRIALDDSGMGLASLQHMAGLAPDFVKLDRSLTHSVDSDSGRRALAFAFLSFAAQAGAVVIAEGIETRDELGALRGLGATYGQGYLIARPLRLDDPSATVPERLELPAAPNHTLAREADASAAPAQHFRTFLDGVRATLDTLEQRIPGSAIMLGHLDYSARVFRVVDSRGPADLHLAPGRTFPLNESPSYHMASGRGPRLCGDIASEAIYASLPIVQETDAMSFAGAALQLSDGTRIGTLSALHPRADAYDESALDTMRTLAASLAGTLEHEHAGDALAMGEVLRRYATVDWLTGVMNGSKLRAVIEHQWGRPRRDRVSTYVVRVKVCDLEAVNHRYGRTLGDLLLKDIASCLEASAKVSDIVGRLSGAEFGAVLVGCSTEEGASYFCKALSGRLGEQLGRRELAVDVIAGVASLGDSESAEAALATAATRTFKVG